MDKIVNQPFFSPGDECLDAIITCIRSAYKCLDVCVFTIADDRITKELLYRHYGGLEIKIITDNDKCYDRGSDIEEMVEKGIKVKVDNTPYHMHHKFMVIDDQYLLTGSFNWTRSASERNHENLVILDEKQIVKSYRREFDKLWKELVWY